MKLKKSLILLFPLAAIVLELLPYGAVLNFATPEKTIRQTYSYFSLTPFGYANFGPFITAILTCVIFLLALLYARKGSNRLKIAILNLSGLATVTSLLPLMFGLHYLSPTGVIISLLLALEFGAALYNPRVS